MFKLSLKNILYPFFETSGKLPKATSKKKSFLKLGRKLSMEKKYLKSSLFEKDEDRRHQNELDIVFFKIKQLGRLIVRSIHQKNNLFKYNL
jgi:hypothetical protein